MSKTHWTAYAENAGARDVCPEGHHDWESGTWGVIIGVSRCKRCGVRSRQEHFTDGAPTP